MPQNRQYFPEEEDVNYKRFILRETPEGNIEQVDLLNEEITITRVEPGHVSLYFYTKNDPNNPIILDSQNADELKNTQFNPNNEIVFIIHGWSNDYSAFVNTELKRAIFQRHDVNIFIVDWSPIASQGYTTAKGAVEGVGVRVSAFINNIFDIYDVKGDRFTLIGHSLGAHIAGNAGSGTKYPIKKICGLDPAGPLFSVATTTNRLDPGDASYVVVIHTNGNLLGFSSSIGHADYYPNGGMKQVGCGIDLTGSCAHSRSIELLSEAIDGTSSLVGTLCGSYDDFQKGRCAEGARATFGEIFSNQRYFYFV